MRIAVIGASGAGLPFAALLLQKHPDWDVHLFDANSKVGKKLLATGNGHCNLLNASATPDDYNNPSFVSTAFERFPYPKLKGILLGLGVPLLEMGDLIYPKSFTSSGYVDVLTSYIKNKGGHTHLETKILDYQKRENKWVLQGFESEKPFDKLVFCSGGKSGRNLGSDGNLFSVFAKHGYELTPFKPALCPVKTVESTSSLNGIRHAARISLLSGDQELYSESGELLFKKDGLSGIAVFNVQRKLAHEGGDAIAIDLFPDQSRGQLSDELFSLADANPDFAPAFIPIPLFDYCKNAAKVKDLKSKGDVDALCRVLKHLVFNVSAFYDYPDSQVTIGGISLNEISDKNYESKRESNVYFLGEVLDVDGPCGGYNLEWCLVSALNLVESL